MCIPHTDYVVYLYMLNNIIQQVYFFSRIHGYVYTLILGNRVQDGFIFKIDFHI